MIGVGIRYYFDVLQYPLCPKSQIRHPNHGNGNQRAKIHAHRLSVPRVCMNHTYVFCLMLCCLFLRNNSIFALPEQLSSPEPITDSSDPNERHSSAFPDRSCTKISTVRSKKRIGYFLISNRHLHNFAM